MNRNEIATVVSLGILLSTALSAALFIDNIRGIHAQYFGQRTSHISQPLPSELSRDRWGRLVLCYMCVCTVDIDGDRIFGNIGIV